MITVSDNSIYIDGSKSNFIIQEFVPESIFNKYYDSSIWYVSEWQVRFAQFLRDRYEVSVTINDWAFGGTLNLRGTRPPECGLLKHLREEGLDEENIQQIQGYMTSHEFKRETLNIGSWLSQHKYKSAIDYNVEGMSADECRRDILGNQELFMAQGLTTIESGDFAPTWCHAGCRITGMDEIFIVTP